MAGILPFSKVIKNNKTFLYFLFSRETLDDDKSKDKGYWSEFGGSADKGESRFDTAIREGYEESNGVFGSKSQMKNKVKKTGIYFKEKSYYSFLMQVPYDRLLPTYLENTYNFIKVKKPDLICCEEGLFEKDKFRWIEINQLEKNMNIFRPFYRPVIKQIINNKEQIMDNSKK
jgi:8-oxo-dGTP pyrophosphatase MutT (NUDIX family)